MKLNIANVLRYLEEFGLYRPFKYAITASIVIVLLSLFMPNYYTSEARILAKDPKGATNMGGAMAALAAVGVGLSGASDTSTAYLDILKSRWVADHLLESTFSYHERSWYFGDPKPVQGTLRSYLRSINNDRAVKDLRKYLTFDRDLKTGLLTIRATTTSQDLSQQVARACTIFLEEFITTNSRTQGKSKAEFAKQRVKEAETKTEEATERLRAFHTVNRNYLVTTDPLTRLAGARLEAELALRGQVQVAVTLALEQALMEEKDDTPTLTVLDSGHFPEDKATPQRSMLVIGCFIFVGLLSYLGIHRRKVITYLFSDRH